MPKPPFDPNQPYEEYKPPFDPNQSFEPYSPESMSGGQEYRQDYPGRRLASKIYTPLLETAGMMTAGPAASILAAPTGPVGMGVAGLAGAGAGYAAGRGVAEDIDRYLGITGREEIPPIGGQVKETFKSAGEGVAYELGGRALSGAAQKIISKGLAPFASGITPETRAAVETADRLGIPTTAAERSGSKTVSLGESFLEKIPFSSDIIQNFRYKQLKALVAERNKLVEKYGDPRAIEDVGISIQDQVDGIVRDLAKRRGEAVDVLRDRVLKTAGIPEPYEAIGRGVQESIASASGKSFEKAGSLYGRVGELVSPKTEIFTPQLESTAKSLISNEKLLPQSLKSNQQIRGLLRDLSNVREAIKGKKQGTSLILPPGFKQAEPKSDIANWEALQALRTRLNELIVSADQSYGNKVGGVKFQSSPEAKIYKQLKGALEKDIDAFAMKSGGELADTYKAAREFYGGQKDLYGGSVKQLLRTKPDSVFNLVVRPRNASEIKKLKGIIGKEEMGVIKDKLTNKLLLEDQPSTFSGKKLADMIRKYGDDTLSEIYSPSELRDLRELALNVGRIEDIPVGNKFFRTILKTDPARVVDYIVKPNNVRNIKIAKSVLSPENLDALRAEVMEKGMKVEGGVYRPSNLTKNLKRLGDDVLKELFEPEQLARIRELESVGSLARGAEKLAGNPSGTAQNIISYSLGKQVMTGIATKPVRTLLKLPLFSAAKGYLSPGVTKYLSEGYKSPDKMKLYSDYISRVLATGAGQ